MKEISLHILDIVQNSITAGATEIIVDVDEQVPKNRYVVEINDNGCGMDEAQLKQVDDPFYTTRTTRKVGLGLSLFKQNAEQSGGSFHVESVKEKGTKVTAVFGFDNIDRPIMGDIAGTMTLLIGANPEIRFIYNHHTPLSDFEFDTEEAKHELEGLSINNPNVLKMIKEIILDNLELIEAKLN
ncbi:MAG TPA: ATP-binding protein [Bacteroidales bacterium]|nr:ATP-binding protein [Bacteroidales bacterium]